MRLVFLGAPGAGKGTQAVRVVEEFGFPHISTGDLLRSEVAAKSELGLKAQEYMTQGKLVPDELVVAMLEGRVAQDDCESGFLLDGFPRTLPQAEALDRALADKSVDRAVFFEVQDDLVIGRITGRRACSGCGANYHVVSLPPKKEGVCDRCGQPLTQRSDDTEELVRERLSVFREQTFPVVEYYRKKKILSTVSADRGIDDVFADVMKELKGQAG